MAVETLVTKKVTLIRFKTICDLMKFLNQIETVYAQLKRGVGFDQAF